MPVPVDEFIRAACVPLTGSHASGTLEEAEAILERHPEIGDHDVFAASILGNDSVIKQYVAADPESARKKGGAHNWDPLTYLCFSRYLRLDRNRSEGFVRSAQTLLAAGADANSGFFSRGHQPQPEFESVLYGAAGVAHHPGVTRLLLERGADPNDGEVVYHSPEDDSNSALKLLIETRKLTATSLSNMLLRKADWHDSDGIRMLLDAGADPNLVTIWGFTALHQALRRDNALQNIELMLNHGADPMVKTRAEGCTAVAIAARRGRADALDLFNRRGVRLELTGMDALLAACARGDAETVGAFADQQAREELKANGGRPLGEFAGNGNSQGLWLLHEVGVPLGALYEEGDGYFGIAGRSTALHVAAWRARHETVNWLLEHGAEVNAVDGNGRTPLILAVLACVDSYWQSRRSSDSVQALLQKGASTVGVGFPSGYAPVDELLKRHGAVPNRAG